MDHRKKHRNVQCHDAIEENGQSPFVTSSVLYTWEAEGDVSANAEGKEGLMLYSRWALLITLGNV